MEIKIKTKYKVGDVVLVRVEHYFWGRFVSEAIEPATVDTICINLDGNELTVEYGVKELWGALSEAEILGLYVELEDIQHNILIFN